MFTFYFYLWFKYLEHVAFLQLYSYVLWLSLHLVAQLRSWYLQYNEARKPKCHV